MRPLVAIVLAVGFLLAIPFTAAAAWQTTEQRSAFAGQVVASASAPDGGMAVAYTDGADLYINQVTTGGAWSTACQVSSGSEPYYVGGADAAIAINAAGRVVVAWVTSQDPEQIAAAYRTSASCPTAYAVTATAKSSAYVSAAIDSAGRTFVGWASDNNTFTSKVQVRSAANADLGTHTVATNTLSLALGVTAGDRLVAAVAYSDHSGVGAATYLSGTWSTLTTVATDTGVGSQALATNPGSASARVFYEQSDVSNERVKTVWIADAGNLAAASSPITLRTAASQGDPAMTTTSATMAADGSSALLWEYGVYGPPTPTTIIATTCAAAGVGSPCASSDLEQYTNPSNSASTFSTFAHGASIALASSGAATAIWRTISAANGSIATLRYATRSAGAWTAAADVPTAGGALNVTDTGSSVLLGGDANGAAMVIGRRSSDGFIASKALTAAPAPMAAPTAVGGSRKATVSWTTPTTDLGYAALTATPYTVTASPGGATCTGSGTSCDVTGLTYGTSYTFTVTAANATGTSAASAASSAVSPTATVSGAPATASASADQDSSVLVSWTAPASDGGADVTSYTVTSSPSSTCTTVTATSCRASSLTPGTSYTFTVKAVNAVGAGAETTASATPTSVPGAPGGVAVSQYADSVLEVTWTASAANGAAVTYAVASSPSVTCTTQTATSCRASGLTPGTTYTFTVTPSNARGTGPSGSASGVAATTPPAPTGVVATAGNQEAIVEWTQAANGFSPITQTTVTATAGGQPTRTCTASGAALSCTVGSLTNDVVYTFSATAQNAMGTGAASSTTTATPHLVPNTPTGTTVLRGDGSIAVTWTDSTPNATTITDYTATATPGGASCTASSGTAGCSISGLANGTVYTVKVVANATGGGSLPSSGASASPAGAPLAPTGVTATATAEVGVVVVSWTAADDNGEPVTGYAVAGSPSGSCSTAATSCTITGLTGGVQHTFTVTATNAIGTSATSQLAAATPTSAAVSTDTASSASPPVPRILQIAPGRTLTRTALLSRAQIKVPKGARVAVRVAGAAGGLKRKGTGLVGAKPGTYTVTLTVTPKTGKKTTGTVTVVVGQPAPKRGAFFRRQ